jgi:hypothetical protein
MGRPLIAFPEPSPNSCNSHYRTSPYALASRAETATSPLGGSALSVTDYRAAHEQDRLFTIEGLASTFGISVETIRKYITWGHVDYARGRNHDGFNYDMDHYRQISALRHELARQRAKPRGLSSCKPKRSHTIIVTRGMGVVA